MTITEFSAALYDLLMEAKDLDIGDVLVELDGACQRLRNSADIESAIIDWEE